MRIWRVGEPLTSSCKGLCRRARGIASMLNMHGDAPIYTLQGRVHTLRSTVEMFQSKLHAYIQPKPTYAQLQPRHPRPFPTPGWLHLLVLVPNQQTHCVIGHGWAGAWLPQAVICHRHTARKCRLFRHRLVFLFGQQLIHFSCPPQTHSSRFFVSIVLSYWFLA